MTFKWFDQKSNYIGIDFEKRSFNLISCPTKIKRFVIKMIIRFTNKYGVIDQNTAISKFSYLSLDFANAIKLSIISRNKSLFPALSLLLLDKFVLFSYLR